MRLACMFPGQGSQSMGMLQSIYEQDAVIAQTFSEASEVLNLDLWHMVAQGPESALNDTINTQVVMLVADVAMYRLLRRHGMPQPEMMAGHSLGEYAALVCAEAVDFADAIRLVRRRATLMQSVMETTQGAMAAIIGLDNAVVENICANLSEAHPEKVLQPANYNAPGQLVIAGHQDMIELSLPLFQESGARLTKVLAVSIPCHCQLMEPAAKEFAQELQKTPMQLPKVKLISNVDLSIYQSVDTMKTLLAQQLYKPVRWTETLHVFADHQIDTVIECGPGKVLSGLVKRTQPEFKNLFCCEWNQLPTWDNI